MKPKTIIISVLAVLCLIILIQNTQIIILRLFFWKVSMSQIVLMILTMLTGFLLGVGIARSKKSK